MNDSEMKTVVIVIGIPRSGRSVAAGVLHRLGCSMGDSLRPPDRLSQAGSFEDLSLLGLARVLVHPAGDERRQYLGLPASRRDPSRAPASWFARLRRAYAARRLAAGGRPWGFAGPFTAACVAELVSCLEADETPRLVVVGRDPDEARMSLLSARYDFRPADPFEIVAEASRAVEAAVAGWGEGRIEVDFDAAIRRPSDLVERLAAELGLEPTAAAARAIDPSLRWHGR